MFFPAFIPIQHRPILLVGAGQVALGKADKLLPFGPDLRVIALEALPQFTQWADEGHLTLELRNFEMSDLEGYDLVIMAVDDVELQKQVFEICKKKRVLCNCVDVPEYCSWIFPALVKRKNFVVGISTGGKAPFLAGTLKKWVDQALPLELDDIVAKVDQFRQSTDVLRLKTATERGQKVISFARELLKSVSPAERQGPSKGQTSPSSEPGEKTT